MQPAGFAGQVVPSRPASLAWRCFLYAEHCSFVALGQIGP